jgi:prepilin-type N-terminal cleavage/methylation domain-containing protein/prepilin-type processing-associated H-X9-DG protein
MRKSVAKRNSAGRLMCFTLIELLVVIAIIAILAALLMPALRMAMARSKQIQCMSNIKQLSYAVNLYVNDYNGRLPCLHTSFANPFWFNLVEPYSGTKVGSSLWQCPSMDNHHIYGDYGGQKYTMSDSVYFPMSKFKRTSQLILLIDAYHQVVLCGSWFAVPPNCGGNSREHSRHFKGPNILFLDGHAGWAKGLDVDSNKDDMWGIYDQ